MITITKSLGHILFGGSLERNVVAARRLELRTLRI
jgi:hypothetical protein